MICYLCGNEYTVDPDDVNMHPPMLGNSYICFDCYDHETFTCNDCEETRSNDECFVHFYEDNGKKMFKMLCHMCVSIYDETMQNCSKLIEK